jgi:ATP-dependent helicase/nuclease subunit B
LNAPAAQLTFLGWDAPALPLAARLLAEAGARPGALELRDRVVVLPGARAGRRLKELLLEEAEARGVPLFPPRVVGVGQLPELLYEPPRPLADGLLARRLWSRTLRQGDAQSLHAVFPHPPAADDLVGWETLAAEVQRLHAEVGAGGHGFADVAERCASGSLHFDDAPRWRPLAEVEARYAALLERVGRADPNRERIAAARSPGGKPASPLSLVLIGIAELSTLARQMLLGSGAAITALVHAPEEESAAFDALGCVRPEAWERRRIDIPDTQLVTAGRPPEQATEAMRALERLQGRFAAEQITIAVPDEALVPYLERRLGEAGVPSRYAGGRPVQRSRPYRFLAAAAEFARGRAWDDFAALLRHPDVGEWLRRNGAGEGVLADADAHHAQRLPARLPPAAGRGGAGEEAQGPGVRRGRGEPELPRARAALEEGKLLGRLHGADRRLSQWMEPILGLLLELYTRTPLSRDIPEEQQLVDVFEQVKAAAAALHALPAEGDDVCDAGTAVRLLLEEVGGKRVPEEPHRAAVELVGWLELHLDDAPAAVVTGFNEPYLPQSVTADAFLPDSLRCELGLEDNARRYARDAYQLTAVLASRPHVTLVSGRYSADGDPLRPSRLMLAEEGGALARRLLRHLDGGEGAAGATAAPADAGATAAPDTLAAGGFGLPPERVLTFPPPDSLPVTAFRTLIDDPYLFVLQHLLRLQPLDDAAREMDGRLFGDLAHAVLQDFGRSDARHATDGPEIARALDRLLEARAAGFGAHALPAVRIQLEQLRQRLHAFAAWQAERTRSGWEIEAVEGRLLEEEAVDAAAQAGPQGVLMAPFPVDGVPFTLRGRIDRIDRHRESGEVQILDFKTGDRPEEPERTHRRRNGAWKDLQLPLYRHLAATLTRFGGRPLIADADAVTLGYVLLPRELERTGECLARWDVEVMHTADDTARQLIRELRQGRIEFQEGRGGDGPLAPLLGRRLLVAAETSEAADREEEG